MQTNLKEIISSEEYSNIFEPLIEYLYPGLKFYILMLRQRYSIHYTQKNLNNLAAEDTEAYLDQYNLYINTDQIDDVLQDVLVSLLERLPKFINEVTEHYNIQRESLSNENNYSKVMSHIRIFAYKLCKSVFYTHIKKIYKDSNIFINDMTDELPNITNLNFRNTLTTHNIEKIISKLNSSQKRIIELILIGENINDISKQLEISVREIRRTLSEIDSEIFYLLLESEQRQYS